MLDDEGGAFAVIAWLQSPAGQRCIAHELERLRLPRALDTDLEGVVGDEAVRHVHAHGPIESPAAWARQRVHARAVDFLRAELRYGRVERIEPGVPVPEPIGPETIGPESSATAAFDHADAVRHRLVALLDMPLWALSAALTFLARRVDGAPLPADCPQPKRGADEVDAAWWAGLWFAGRHDCFPEGRDTAALRQQRSRQVRTAKEWLAVAAGVSRG